MTSERLCKPIGYFLQDLEPHHDNMLLLGDVSGSE